MLLAYQPQIHASVGLSDLLSRLSPVLLSFSFSSSPCPSALEQAAPLFLVHQKQNRFLLVIAMNFQEHQFLVCNLIDSKIPPLSMLQ